MEIKLSLQEVVLLQKMKHEKFNLPDFRNHMSAVIPLIDHNLCAMFQKATDKHPKMLLTPLGRKVLENHLPIIIQDSDITVPQSYKG